MPLQADSLHKCFHRFRSCASRIHSPPVTVSILSLHLFLCRPFFLVLPLGVHSVDFFAHRLFFILAMCPAQFHFRVFAFEKISCTFVCSRTTSFLHLSLLVMFNIDLSMLRCSGHWRTTEPVLPGGTSNKVVNNVCEVGRGCSQIGHVQ